MSEEEPVCPKPEIEEACKPKCIKLWLEYQVGCVPEEWTSKGGA